MNHTQSAAGLGGQPQPQQQPQFNMASAFFGHYGPATANNMIHHHQRGFVTSTPVQSSNGLNLSSSSGSASASSSSSSGLNSSSSPEDGKVEKLSRSHQYKKVSFYTMKIRSSKSIRGGSGSSISKHYSLMNPSAVTSPYP